MRAKRWNSKRENAHWIRNRSDVRFPITLIARYYHCKESVNLLSEMAMALFTFERGWKWHWTRGAKSRHSAITNKWKSNYQSPRKLAVNMDLPLNCFHLTREWASELLFPPCSNSNIINDCLDKNQLQIREHSLKWTQKWIYIEQEWKQEKHGDYVFTATMQCIVLLQLIFTDSVYQQCMNIKTTKDATSEEKFIWKLCSKSEYGNLFLVMYSVPNSDEFWTLYKAL
jgi:hypothetical protein